MNICRQVDAQSAAATKSQLVVLGAGRPFAGRAHSALRLLEKDRKVLDWILHAFEAVTTDVVFVGGYGMAEVAAAYPFVNFKLNPDWAQTGAAGSLLMLQLDGDRDLYVCYSDIVFRPDVVARLSSAAGEAVVVAVDASDRASARARRNDCEIVRIEAGKIVGIGREGEGVPADLIGLMYLPRGVSAVLNEMRADASESLRQGHLSILIAELMRRGVDIRIVHAQGEWSNLDCDGDLTRFVFGSKAETLDRLRERVTRSEILPQVRFTVAQWNADQLAIFSSIVKRLGQGPFAVRSSATTEDGFTTSNAGRFHSELNVPSNKAALAAAVARVIESFGEAEADHQIFVQPMVSNVVLSGVALTRTSPMGGPYITVAWSEGADTDGVTSGNADRQRVAIVHRERGGLPSSAPESLKSLLAAIAELEFLSDSDTLDIEFAIRATGDVHVLQVRPLILSHDRTTNTDAQVAEALRMASEQWRALTPPPPKQVGRSAVWGVMPDWNPAEIVGIRPSRLAFDLYAFLITDDVWAKQRAQYGYRDVRPWPLIRQFAGHAYVDVRASFNSFVPAEIGDTIAAKLVDHYLDHLKRQPELHDKIEFDVALTSWSFDIEGRIVTLADAIGTSAGQQLSSALASITAKGIARVGIDFAQAKAFDEALNSQLGQGDLHDAIELLEMCRTNGTLPFAHLARGAFVAMTLIRSAVKTGLIAGERAEAFLRSVTTVGQKLVQDAVAVREGGASFEMFCARYGHLRPGTYDVTSPAYRDAPERFLLPLVEQAKADAAPVTFEWTAAEANLLTSKLRVANIDVDIVTLDDFFRTAIEGREYAKFVFTRALSRALDVIKSWGERSGLSAEQLPHLSYGDIRAATAGKAIDELAAKADAVRAEARISSFIELPPLMCRESDLHSFEYPATQPNFVTDRAVIAPPLALEDGSVPVSLEGKIVVIPRADPGFDWIFGHKILGFITVYGGANSHMAIRAAEFGLPAAIGVGEVRFQALKGVRLVELNCRERRVRAVEHF